MAGDNKSMESIAKNDNSDPMDDNNDQHKNYAVPQERVMSPMPQWEDASTPLCPSPNEPMMEDHHSGAVGVSQQSISQQKHHTMRKQHQHSETTVSKLLYSGGTR